MKAIALLSLLLFGCTPKPLPKVETSLNVALSHPIKSLDPAAGDDNLVLPNLYDTLPSLADISPTPNGAHVLVHLKHGIRFHNGREVTATDFIYSWARVPKLKIKARVVDPYTLEFDRKEYRPEVLARYASAVVPREAVEQFGDDFGNHPVGTGPYRFESWIHGNKVNLRRDHGDGVDALNIFEMPDAAVRWMNLVKGALDFDVFDPKTEMNPRVLALGIRPSGGYLFQAWVENFEPTQVAQGQFSRLRINPAKKLEYRAKF